MNYSICLGLVGKPSQGHHSFYDPKAEELLATFISDSLLDFHSGADRSATAISMSVTWQGSVPAPSQENASLVSGNAQFMDNMRRLIDRSQRQVFGSIVRKCTADRGLSFGAAITVASAIFWDCGGARQLSVGSFAVVSDNKTSEIVGRGGVVGAQAVTEYSCMLTLQTSFAGHLPNKTAQSDAVKATKADPSAQNTWLSRGQSMLIHSMLTSTEEDTATTPEAQDLFSKRWKAAKVTATAYLNNAWLPSLLQSKRDSLAGSASTPFPTLRQLFCSGTLTDKEGKKKKASLAMAWDEPSQQLGEAAEEPAEEETEETKRVVGKKAAREEGTSANISPNHPHPIFMADPGATVISNLLIAGVDSLYAYLAVELCAKEYHAVKAEEKRNKTGKIDDEEEGAAPAGAKPRSKWDRKWHNDNEFHAMRAPRTFGVVGRIPLPSSTSSTSSAATPSPQYHFSNYKTFISKNRQNKAHMAGGELTKLDHTGPVQPPAHIVWLNESSRPKKPSELLSIRWVDGRDLFDDDKDKDDMLAATAGRNLSTVSLLVFSWVMRGLVGKLASPSSADPSSYVTLITELEDTHFLSLAHGSEGPLCKFTDVCDSIEGSVARLVKRAAKVAAASTTGHQPSATQSLVAKLEDCGNVYFTEHLLGKNHPYARWLSGQRKAVAQLADALTNRVWRIGQPITEKDVLDKAAVVTSMGAKHADISKQPAPAHRLEEGPCIEFKQKASEYSHTGLAQVDAERLRHTIAAMGATGGGVIIVGVKDSDGVVVGHAAGALKGHLRATAFFPALPKDSVRVMEVKVRHEDSTAAASGAPKSLPAGWWKTLTSSSASSVPIVPAPASSPTPVSGHKAASEVVTIVAVEPSPSPFVLPTIRSHTRHGKVRAGGAGNATLSVCGIANRLLLFAPDE